MLVTLTGDNSFSLDYELRRLVNSFKAEYGDLAVEQIDAEEAEYDQVHESLRSLGLLSDKKLVIVHSGSKNSIFADKIEQVLANIPETTDVILVEPSLDKRRGIYKKLQTSTDFRQFSELDREDLARWLVESATNQNGSLKFIDARYLIERVGLNQQLLSSELNKLLLYNCNITRGTIDLLTEAAPQSTIFQLMEAAFAGRSKQALILYAEQRAMKVEPPQIIALLAWQLNILAIIKSSADRALDQIAKEAGINPYVVRKSQTIANDISLADLKQLIKSLLDIDIKIKRTNINPDEALNNYLIRLGRS